MLFKIRDIPDEGLTSSQPVGRALLQDALAGLSSDLDRAHADARFTLHRVERDVLLRGAVTGEVAVPCVRCLGEVAVPLDAPVAVMFTPAEDEPDEDGDDKIDDDLERVPYDGHSIDVAPSLREAIILAVPMAPLCRPDCQGLCPVCGGDRNRASCGCRPATLDDPRLAPLKGLKL